MPHLSDLWSEISSRRDDVVFLSVNIGDDEQLIADWWRDEGFRHRAVRQQGREVSAAFGVDVYPTNFVIDPGGRILYAAAGWDEDRVRGALQATAR